VMRTEGLLSSQYIALTQIGGLIFGRGDKNHDAI